MKVAIPIIIFVIIFTVGCTDKEKYPDTSLNDGMENDNGNIERSKNVIDLAKKDILHRFNIPEDEIQIDQIIPVEWTDKSLGYPEENKTYNPETIPGYVILIKARDKFYEYHSDYNKITPPSGPIENIEDKETIDILGIEGPAEYTEDIPIKEITMVKDYKNKSNSAHGVVKLAKDDLASRLNISGDNIEVLGIIPIKWPDTSLGVPVYGMKYARVITPGFMVTLSAENNIYEYHSDYKRVVLADK